MYDQQWFEYVFVFHDGVLSLGQQLLADNDVVQHKCRVTYYVLQVVIAHCAFCEMFEHAKNNM